jgi:hypothetical protein
MATTVPVDADDLAYLAELAAMHLEGLGWPADNEAARGPIIRAFRTLEHQAPGTFDHQYDLWGLVREVDDKGGAW